MFSLGEVVPWGRSLDEYCRMFAHTSDDLRCRIVGCADGPASFNAEATAAGLSVTSCDPLYGFKAAEIATRIAATTDVRPIGAARPEPAAKPPLLLRRCATGSIWPAVRRFEQPEQSVAGLQPAPTGTSLA